MTNPDVDHLTKLLKTREEIVLGAVLWDTRDKEPSRLVYILVKVRCLLIGGLRIALVVLAEYGGTGWRSLFCPSRSSILFT